ncbi:hypothetical protein Kisp01_55260 [Kineosporia sp. NBRC 101677]|nr:hypothetical protein Kisp01_55260 [Kineosporia sp. NBRC 101677]
MLAADQMLGHPVAGAGHVGDLGHVLRSSLSGANNGRLSRLPATRTTVGGRVVVGIQSWVVPASTVIASAVT